MSAPVEAFERFSDLFVEPILLVTSEGHLCAANGSARTALLGNGATPSTQTIFEFVSETQGKVLPYLQSCARSAQPLPGMFTFKEKNGTGRLPFRCFGCSFRSRDVEGRALIILRFVPKEASTSRFITLNQQIDQLQKEVARRSIAERMVDEQRRLLQITLSSIGDAVITTDVVGEVTFMNPPAEAHIGLSLDQCVGRPLGEVFVLLNETTRLPVESPVSKVLRSGEVVALANHTVLIRHGGEELPIDDTAAPIRDSEGTMLGVVLVFHEISESRKLQRELTRHTEALEEASRRKDQFLAVLAHELRNPLAPLRNGLQIVRLKVPNDPTIKNVIQMMERQLAHVVRLIDDLMDVSRVTRGVIELKCVPLRVGDVLARSIEGVRASLEARGHEISVEMPTEPLVINGDDDRLVQIFSNLFANSSKYSPDGGSIRVGVTTEQQEIVVTVQDNGIGIPTDQLERVFDMFSQVRLHQGRAEGGLGIGLSLVRTLVELHSGSIVAHSEGPGRGSTFTLRLPLLESSEQVSLPATSSTSLTSTALRAVIADDNVDVANSLKMLLEHAGHRVRIATNGREAVRLVDQLRPAIVFMDIGMPDLDGIRATEIIKARPHGKDVVVVAVTGWGQPQDVERTKAAGVDAHFVKPMSVEDLARALSLVTNRSIK